MHTVGALCCLQRYAKSGRAVAQLTKPADTIPREQTSKVQPLEAAIARQYPGISLEEVGLRDPAVEGSPRLKADLALASKVARFFNKEVVVVRNNTPEVFDFGGVILSTEFPYLQVTRHELLHLMRRDNPALYDELYGVVAPLLIRTYPASVDSSQHGTQATRHLYRPGAHRAL